VAGPGECVVEPAAGGVQAVVVVNQPTMVVAGQAGSEGRWQVVVANPGR